MLESLKRKTLKGIGWSTIDNLFGSGITFIVGLVLARILSPAEFGLIGMITVFIAISNAIIDSGFSNALIRKVDVNDDDYNTVFYINLVLSLLMYFVLFVSAPTISSFFKQPLLVPITRVIGVVLVFNGLGHIQRTIMVKNIDFKTLAIISFISSIVSAFVGIGMALRGYGVWSLVGQQISKQLLTSLCLWIFNKWRPKLIFSKNSFNQLFSFGVKLLFVSLIDTIWKNIYYFVIGKIYKADVLGQYTRADMFRTIFSSNLTSVIQRVSYPVLSSIQEDHARLKYAYKKVIKMTMLVTFACMLGLAAVSRPLIIVLIGEKWLVAASYLPILCFAGMLYPLHAINLNMLQVKGRSDLCLKLEIVKKLIAAIPILLGIFINIEWMLWGSVASSVIAYFLNSYYSAGLISYSTWDQLKDIFPSFIVSVVVALIMWSITLFPFNEILILVSQIIVGTTIAYFIYKKIELEEFNDITVFINNKILHRVK